MYLIDIIKLLNNEELDKTLIALLTQETTTILGIGFKMELETLS